MGSMLNVDTRHTLPDWFNFHRDLCTDWVRANQQPIGGPGHVVQIDFQLCLHRLLMSTGCKSSHNGFLDVSRSTGGLSISGCIGSLYLASLSLYLASLPAVKAATSQVLSTRSPVEHGHRPAATCATLLVVSGRVC